MSAATIDQAGEVRLARLESLRALGALGVLLGHAWLFGNIAAGHPGRVGGSFADRVVLSGGFGLELFFALTGYLLYWPFVRRDFGGGDPVDLRGYARNRVFRVLPLYYAVVVVLLLAQEHGGSGTQWWRFGLMVQSFWSDTVGTVDGPMWSLVVEVQFYVLLPLLALAVGRAARGRLAVAAAMVAGLGLVSLGLHWHFVAHASTTPDLRWEYSLPVNFGFLAAGMLVALARAAWQGGARLPALARRGELWLGASAVLYLLAARDFRLVALTAPASALAVAACVLPGPASAPLLRVLDTRVLAAVGVASYSLYLWHFPILDALDGRLDSFVPLLLGGGALALVAALVSFRVLETPFLRLRRRWSPAAAAQRSGAR